MTNFDILRSSLYYKIQVDIITNGHYFGINFQLNFASEDTNHTN